MECVCRGEGVGVECECGVYVCVWSVYVGGVYGVCLTTSGVPFCVALDT